MLYLFPRFSKQQVLKTPLQVRVDHVCEDHEDLAKHYKEFIVLVKVEVASELRDELDDMEQLIE